VILVRRFWKEEVWFTKYDLEMNQFITIWKCNNSYNYQLHIPLLRGVRGVL
jgi:hypothetical protein